MLKVGFIDYKNTLVFGIDSIQGIQVIRDIPSKLNQMLFNDEIDVGIISSAEYIQHYFKYFIFPDISISSRDSVKSVLLLSNIPIEEVETIYLTKESKSSVFLTKVIFEKFLGKKPEYKYFESVKNKQTIMVIGDLALELEGKFKYTYDLAQIWYQKTSLPFTFALWCVRKEALYKRRKEVEELYIRLKENRDNFLKDIDKLQIDNKIKEYLKNIDYSLNRYHIESMALFSKYLYQLGIIKSIPDFRFIDGSIITRDGTQTLYNFEYQEAYHSTKAGAYTESLEKFVIPSGIDKLLKNGKKVRILDVGFGLGYNVATVINFSRQIVEKPKLEIISIEKDESFLDRIKSIEYPENLQEEYKIITSLEESVVNIADKNLKCYKKSVDNISITVLIIDGREGIRALNSDGKKFDIVFYDPFSPKVNTEMWTYDILRLVSELIEDEGVFLTYSNATPVKVSLLKAGFRIGYVKPVGRKSPSIIASKNGNIEVVGEEEIKKILNSEFSVPYRDEDFSLSSKEIFERWQREVKSRQQPA